MKHPLLQNSFGNPPEVVQDDVYPEGVVAMDFADEANTLLIGTGTGHLVLIDRHGEQLKRQRGFENLQRLVWSNVGNFGVIARKGGTLVCVDDQLQKQWTVKLTGEVVGLAISPFGSHVAVSTESSRIHIVTSDKNEVANFETQRPLEFLQFLVERTGILGAAEFGHLCAYDIDGTMEWDERIMNNVGNMVVTADGNRILLSAFNHGVQVLSSRGRQKGSFMVDGIPDYVAVAASKRRLVTRTIEHRLYWMSFEGDISWGCDLSSDPARHLCVAPLGDRLYVATQSGRLLQLQW